MNKLEKLACESCGNEELTAYGEKYALCEQCGKFWKVVPCAWKLEPPNDLIRK